MRIPVKFLVGVVSEVLRRTFIFLDNKRKKKDNGQVDM